MPRSYQHLIPYALAACLTAAVPFWDAAAVSWPLKSRFAFVQFFWLFTGFYSFILSDRLVKHLHRQHHPMWGQLGQPVGFLWAPPGVSWFRQLHTLTISNDILLGRVTPAFDDLEFKRLRLKYVSMVILSIIAGLCFFPVFFRAAKL